jgi:hypothetical protein
MAERMRVGWLWFDSDSGRTVEEKVQRAAERFRAKFGRRPDTCYVNPQAMEEKEQQCGEVHVIAAQHILPHHFWLGIAAGRQDPPRIKTAA